MAEVTHDDLVYLLMLIGNSLGWEIEATLDDEDPLRVNQPTRLIRTNIPEDRKYYINDLLAEKVNNIFDLLKASWNKYRNERIVSLAFKILELKKELKEAREAWYKKGHNKGSTTGYDKGYSDGKVEGKEIGFRDGYRHATGDVLPNKYISRDKVAMAIRDFCGHMCPNNSDNWFYRCYAISTSTTDVSFVKTVGGQKLSCHNCPIFQLERLVNEPKDDSY